VRFELRRSGIFVAMK